MSSTLRLALLALLASIAHLNRTLALTPAAAVACRLGLTVALGGLLSQCSFSLPILLLAVAAASLLILWRSLATTRTLSTP